MFHNSDVYIKIDLKIILSKAKYCPILDWGRSYDFGLCLYNRKTYPGRKSVGQ